MITETVQSSAVLSFFTGWVNTVQGEIRAGEPLIIRYDPERLPNCHRQWSGADIWNITVYIRVHPGGHVHEESVLEPVLNPPERGMTVGHRPKAVRIVVPPDARELELWFRTWYQLTSFCEAWDSRFGENYWFTVRGSTQEITK